ncbi:hypothetical protein FRB99_004049 [Tulasnella sp. 403]|nr:hypothetical protein FRB99_004049 [Tulasnella sp. 403]
MAAGAVRRPVVPSDESFFPFFHVRQASSREASSTLPSIPLLDNNPPATTSTIYDTRSYNPFTALAYAGRDQSDLQSQSKLAFVPSDPYIPLQTDATGLPEERVFDMNTHLDAYRSEQDVYGGLDDYPAVSSAPPSPSTSSSGGYGQANARNHASIRSSGTLPMSKSTSYSSLRPYRDSDDPSGSWSSPNHSQLDPSSQPTRQPAFSNDLRSSGSSYSMSSRQLGVELPDHRSTWRSDITGTTVDAFAFRDYESPMPPKVIITGPMTPRSSVKDAGQEVGWDPSFNAPSRHDSFTPGVSAAPPSPPASQDAEHETPSSIQPSSSGRTRSLYNASNFSRPLRGSEKQDGSAERPDSVASVYSTASSAFSSLTGGPSLDHSRTTHSSQSHQMTVPNRVVHNAQAPPSILRPATTSPVPSDIPSLTRAHSQPHLPYEERTRKTSIRFQDPRPAPPPPPPAPPNTLYSVLHPHPQLPPRSISNIESPTSQPPPLNILRSQSASPRAHILEQAKHREPPPPPTLHRLDTSMKPPVPPFAGRPGESSRQPSSHSPSGSIYSQYSYYDPDAILPSPKPFPSSASPQSHLSPPDSHHSTTPKRQNAKRPGATDDDVVSAPQTAEDYLQLGITHHLANRLVESASCFEISAKGVGALKGRQSVSTGEHGTVSSHGKLSDESGEGGCVVGMLMWGLTLRCGWGIEKNEQKGFKWLRRAAEHAVEDLEMAKAGDNTGAIRTELILAIYEVGQSFYHGWGVPADKKMAVSYFQVAARLGDPDAQQELAFCNLNGKGCKKNKKEAAKWYRAAVAQGVSDVGLAWIYKDKYM